jgi:hypothetical protein
MGRQIDIVDHEFIAKDGTRAIIDLIVYVDGVWDYRGADFNPYYTETYWEIEPYATEVFPCVWSAWGRACYPEKPLDDGPDKVAWLARYNDELIEIARDHDQAEHERADERRAER